MKTPREPVQPYALAPGDRVLVVAPAGPVRDREALARGLERLTTLGLDPVIAPHCLDTSGYLAGSDADRAADVQAGLDDPTIRAILCARGGYGAMRILEHIDWHSAARDPKPLLGYSDITALLAAQFAETGTIGFHGPMIARPEAHSSQPADEQLQHELLTVFDRIPVVPAIAAPDRIETIHAGSARGRLAGGNLALVVALLGTPWEFDTNGAILCLEDIGEPAYRIDRMLTQLRLAGKLDGCAAILLGDFAPPGGEEAIREHTHAVIDERLAGLEVPVARGWPFGHRANSWTLPIGAMAEVDCDGEPRLTLSEPSVRQRPDDG